MGKTWVLSGAVFACLGVILGAFGAHALKESLSDRSLQIYQTACHYQFIHALALILLGIASSTVLANSNGNLLSAAGWLFSAGIILFSGSLYALALTDIKILGAITPFGGLSFIVGWACFAIAAWKANA
jgi:uncharacterized membrane protein YgdD (TMEM256/DUF423 family)